MVYVKLGEIVDRPAGPDALKAMTFLEPGRIDRSRLAHRPAGLGHGPQYFHDRRNRNCSPACLARELCPLVHQRVIAGNETAKVLEDEEEILLEREGPGSVHN